MRSSTASSSATWSWWWWVSSTWVSVQLTAAQVFEQRRDRAAGVDHHRVAAGLVRHQVGVGQPVVVHRALDDHAQERIGVALVATMSLIHTCYRILDIDRSVTFYEALGFEEMRRAPIRDEADQRVHGAARRRV